ncbi:SPE3 [Mytilus edulis]|uniref:SpeE n=1 Tax=Mytilus edulis TaxID=6550 RepID=A0A8S3TXN4_MYTED|nr:SPE3 [Mytilus edulis]
MNKDKHSVSVGRIENDKCNVEVENLVTKCTISKKNNNDIVSTTSSGVQSCDKAKEHNRKVPESGIIRKIVLKKSRNGMDILIGKTERGRLVLFHMSRKNFELLLPGEHEYSRFNKVLTEDFEDVRTTPFMNDEVNEGILKMEKVAKMKRLIPVLGEPLMTYTDAEIKERNLKYYNTEVHRACFTLPQFAKEKLFPDGESQQQSTVK